MSYCVNCGVKLRNSEKKCPLCSTPIINPNIKNELYEPAYPNNLEKFKKINYKYVLKLLLTVLIIVSLITLFCDFITSKKLSWSIYVVLSILYLTCHLQYIFGKNIYVNHIIELIGTQMFVLIITLLNDKIDWFLKLTLPLTIIIWIYLMLCTYISKRKKSNPLRKLALSLFLSSLILVGTEIINDLFFRSQINLGWSLYAMLPIVIISIIIFIFSFNIKLIDEIKQRIFI